MCGVYSISEGKSLDLAKPDHSFTWQIFSCGIGKWHGECDILWCTNYFICVNYLFNRNKSNFPGNVTSILRGSFISSWWIFWCFINSSLLIWPIFSWEGNVMWIHLNMLGPKVHELYTVVCIIKWYLYCYMYIVDFKTLYLNFMTLLHCDINLWRAYCIFRQSAFEIAG